MSTPVTSAASANAGTKPMTSNLLRYIVGALVLAGLVLLPTVSNDPLLNVSIKCLIAALLAMGFNMLWGQMGLMSFGQAAYYGVGIFVSLHLMNAIEDGSRFPVPLLPLAAAAVGIGIGVVLGWFATRRSGIYFAMITLAVGELMFVIADKWTSFFGGEAGIRSFRSDWWFINFQSVESVYYFTLVWVLLIILALWLLRRSPFGLLMLSIRENEERLRFLGYNAHAIKVVGFALAAGVAAAGGALLAFMNESSNATIFRTHTSAEMVLNTIMGGSGVFLGPALGATVNTLFGYYVGTMTHFWLLYQGVVFVLVIMFASQGLGGLLVDHVHLARQRRLAPLTVPYLLGAVGTVLAAVSLVLVVEVAGQVMADEYQVLKISTQQAWPAVEVWGSQWAPFGLKTLGAVAVLGSLGVWLLRVAAGQTRQVHEGFVKG